MPKIRVEYEVPEGDCCRCDQMCLIASELVCRRFQQILKDTGCHEMKVNRCQPCLDAEVKEGE